MTSPRQKDRTGGRLRLLLITDPGAATVPLADAVARALAGGVTAVQVRAPGAGARELLETTRSLAGPVRRAGALLLVNDRVDVALAAGADGVHLKRSSLGPADARRLLGPDAVIGVSTHAAEEVEAAFAEGADYCVFGPVFRTPSKEGVLDPRGPALYGRVAGAAPGPVLALGGVTAETIGRLRSGPLPGVAVVRAVLATADPARAARALRRAMGDET